MQKPSYAYPCPLCNQTVTGLTRHMDVVHGGCVYKGYTMRSSWEIHVAQELDRRGLPWEYEKVAFRLSDGRIYLPDFHVQPVGHPDYFLEVKGRWIGRARAKFMQFQREYPHITIALWNGRVLRSHGILPSLKGLR